jgi:HEPN domain-containing protein
MDRKGLQELCRTRLREAKALARLGLYDGSYYLAGYAVECALKSCIAKETRKHEFPDRKRAEISHTHNLRELIRAANLEEARLEEAKKDSVFRNNWDTVQLWSEQSRYRTNRPEVVRSIIEAIGDRNHGILRWIKRYW